MDFTISNLNEDCFKELLKRMELKDILCLGACSQQFYTFVLRYIGNKRLSLHLNVGILFDFETIFHLYGNYIHYLAIRINKNIYDYADCDDGELSRGLSNHRLQIRQRSFFDYSYFLNKILIALNNNSFNKLKLLNICYQIRIDFYLANYDFVQSFQRFTDQTNENFFAHLNSFNLLVSDDFYSNYVSKSLHFTK